MYGQAWGRRQGPSVLDLGTPTSLGQELRAPRANRWPLSKVGGNIFRLYFKETFPFVIFPPFHLRFTLHFLASPPSFSSSAYYSCSTFTSTGFPVRYLNFLNRGEEGPSTRLSNQMCGLPHIALVR